MPDKFMKQDRRERTELLNRLRKKLAEVNKTGGGGIVGQNITERKKMKRQVMSKTTQPPEEKRLDTIKEGKIKWFNNTKGWGFIVDGDGVTYFVHHSELTGSGYTTPLEGDAVLFKVERTAKGMKATNVSKESTV